MRRNRPLSIALVAGSLVAVGVVSIVASTNAGASAAAPWSLRINTGGPALTDSTGQSWLADTSFAGGSTSGTTAVIAGAANSVSSSMVVTAGGTDQSVYRNVRSGMSTYAIPVPGAGLYGLRLQMVETTYGSKGKRVFSVTAEGATIASGLDIFQRVGKNVALPIQAQVSVVDSTLDLAFAASVGNASIAGIEVWTMSSSETVPPVTTTTAPPTTTTTAPPTTTTTNPPPSPSGLWKPTPGVAWQWQLTMPVDQSVNVPVYDIEGMEGDASVVASLHAAGRKVICYIEVGGWENYRSDASTFPAVVLGKTVGGWPDEKWLDIRRIDLLGPIMAKRFDQCKAKGFDAIEPDLLDGYSNDTGFPLTAADQLRYNRYIADLAHARGLSIALKNDPEQVSDLVGDFDFAVVEECARYNECNAYAPFIAAGKAVLHVEYALNNAQFCPTTSALGFSSMKKNLNLDAYRVPC